MVAKLKDVEAKAAKPKMSLDASADRVCCLEGGLVRLKAAQAKEF